MKPKKADKKADKNKSGKNNNKGEKSKSEKKFEFRLKLNLWKILIAVFLIIFFVPFLVSVYELQKMDSKLDTSQALSDIKKGIVKEVLVQDSKLILTYEDGETKVTSKEENEAFADLLDKEGIEPSSVNYTVVDQSLTK